MAVSLEQNYLELCRICGIKTSILVGLSIFGNEGISRNLNKKISACLPIQVELEDDLPKLICSDCVYKLDLFCEFRQRSIETQQILVTTLKEIRDCALNQTQNVLNPVQNEQIVQIQPQNEVIYHEQNILTLAEYVPSNDFNDIDISIKNNYLQCKVEIVGDESTLNSNGSIIPNQIGVSGTPIEALGTNFEQNSNSSDSTDSEINQLSNVENDNDNDNDLTNDNWTNLTADKITNDNFDNSETSNFNEFQNGDSNLPPPGSYYVSAGSVTQEIFSESENRTKMEPSSNFGDEFSEIQNVEPKNSKKGVKISLNCNFCQKSFKSAYKLREHEKTHTDFKPYECNICKKEFRCRIGFLQHVAQHTGQYTYSCDQCGKGFICRSYLQVHQRVHDTKRPHNCTQCGAAFKTKQALQDHVNRHLGVKPYKCSECDRAFVTKGLLKAHERSHERRKAVEQGNLEGALEALHPCTVCNKRFVSKSYLQTHMRIHSNDRRHICETCGKRFLTPVDLRIHRTMHTGEKKYLCQQCGKAFARRDALRCHLRSHSGERPYVCPTCGQGFTQYTPMALHMRLHTGDRPFQCDICSKTFVSKSGMLVHKKKHTDTEKSIEKDRNLKNELNDEKI